MSKGAKIVISDAAANRTPEALVALWRKAWQPRLVQALAANELSRLLGGAVLRMVRDTKVYTYMGHETMESFIRSQAASRRTCYSLMQRADRIAQLHNIAPGEDIPDEIIRAHVKSAQREIEKKAAAEEAQPFMLAPYVPDVAPLVASAEASDKYILDVATFDSTPPNEVELEAIETISAKRAAQAVVDAAPRKNRNEAEATADSIAERFEAILRDIDYVRRNMQHNKKRYEAIIWYTQAAYLSATQPKELPSLPGITYDEFLQLRRKGDLQSIPAHLRRLAGDVE